MHTPATAARQGTENPREPQLHANQRTPAKRSNWIEPIREALKTNLNDGLTVDEIVDWIRLKRRSLYDEFGEDEIEKRIQRTLSHQQNRNKPKVWRCADGKWRLSEAWIGAKRMDEAGEASMSTPAVSDCQSTEEVRTPDAHEDVPQHDSPCGPVTGSANDRDVRTPSTVVHRVIEQSDVLPAATQHGEFRSKDSLWGASSEARTCAEPLGHVNTLDSPVTHHRLSADPERPSVERSRSRDRAANAALDSVALEQEVEQVAQATRDSSSQVGCTEFDYGTIVRKLQQRKQERKIQEAKIEAGRDALPDIDALTARAEQAKARRAEQERLLEEAKKSVQSAEGALEAALSGQDQLQKEEQALQDFIRGSEVLRSQLDID